MLQPHDRMTLAEFLAWDARRSDDERFEFLDGEIVAFGQGASLPHNEIVSRIHDVVRAHKSAECFSVVGMQRIVAAETATFPDIVLLCDERDLKAEDQRTSRYPSLIVEVLSPTTASADLLVKRTSYQTIPTLVEYLVVDSQTRYAALYRRVDGALREVAQQSSGRIMLDAIGAAVDLDVVYAGLVA
jgi:Uma2 family endonuclease